MSHIKFNRGLFVLTWSAGSYLYLLYPLAFDDEHKSSRPNA